LRYLRYGTDRKEREKDPGPGMSSSSVIKIRQGLGLTNKVIAVFDGVSLDFMDTYAQAFSQSVKM